MSPTDSTFDLKKPMPMTVLSSAFQDGEQLPARFTADGQDLSPPLRWSNPPVGTRSLAIACEDPDAPTGLFVHWLAWNIHPDQRHVNEGASAHFAPGGLCEGRNGFGRQGYAGPNPPRGERHRYAFHVYALDTSIDLSADATREQLERAMAGHILAEGTLIGRYEH
jgi:Raf kinase inhibitor-like YbhB/YbcL family protein